MRIPTMIAAFALFACAGEHASTSDQASMSGTCNNPPSMCDPITDNLLYCTEECAEKAYCPDYFQTEIDHCRTHNDPGKCRYPEAVPRHLQPCLKGVAPLSPIPSVSR